VSARSVGLNQSRLGSSVAVSQWFRPSTNQRTAV